ncbi:MAG: DUF4417 domain-containing protein [Clostridia bacterium]|nr:DUF4417 domain-containing protein [Clostridia bacterium]
MSLLNCMRQNCRDVFNAFLVRMARYAGLFDFPVIEPTNCIPNRLIPFSKALSSKDYDQWVHFYEDDYLFERIWKNPHKYLEILQQYRGVILPDFSLYRDMPFVMQLWNIYRSRAIGCWLQQNGIIVIPNIRYGDKRTYRICCDGISTGCVIAVGSHGTLKNKIDRQLFAEGLMVVATRLKPMVIVVYGGAPDDVFEPIRELGIEIVVFESEYSKSMKPRQEVV